MKIATWNVNSLRVRLPHLLTWLSEVKPDLIGLQETKMTNEDFPSTAFEEAGYTAIHSGQKAYNGVAIMSRKKAEDVVVDIPDFLDPQRRVLAATINGIRVLNLYIPNGQDVFSTKYQYKLEWLKNLDLFLKAELKKHSKMIVMGDFNIAPDEIDVHDPTLWEGQVLFTKPERQAFKNMLQVGFKDCFRLIAPEEKHFSWWDYRLNAYKRNMGMRIDHILASNYLSLNCTKCFIDKRPREWERPSDHAPVIAEFKLV